MLKFILFVILTYVGIFYVPFTKNYWILSGINSLFYLASTLLIDMLILNRSADHVAPLFMIRLTFCAMSFNVSYFIRYVMLSTFKL